MRLVPLSVGQVYVVVRSAGKWREHPLPPELVARSTILSVFRSENISDYVLVFYNFSQSLALEPLKSVHIFDWSVRLSGQEGLEPAYVPC